MKSKSKWLATIATLAVVFVLVFSLGLSTIFASADVSDEALEKAGRYYGDFTSQEQVDEAKEQMNVSLAEEGMVLLKNDGTLPLAKGARVSVLGIAQDVINETTGSVTESLADAGFNVNPTLAEYYLNDGATYHDYGEEPSLSAAQKSSLSLYSDAAVVVIGRGAAGESDDRELAIEEVDDDTYLGTDQGWKHEAHATGTETVDGIETTVEYKHELQLTDSEQEMIKLAEQSCKKVIVLYTSSNVFEMYNLDQDPNINAIAWIGRLGDGGIVAVGEMLSGEINPSGKTVDEWTRDFTNDPTYANVYDTAYMQDGQVTKTQQVTDENGNPVTDDDGNFVMETVYQTDDDGKYVLDDSGNKIAVMEDAVVTSSYSGLDYEEDIYLGYKFYETYWKEGGYGSGLTSEAKTSDQGDADKWYAENVVYPFGYGLSYTTFSYDLVSVTTNLGADVSNGLSASLLSTSAGDVKGNESATKIVSLTASVKVTNTGTEKGKETVEVYMETPYGVTANGTSNLTGTEKPYLTLVGFGKTDELRPGQSETVEITFNTQDFASYDYSDANGDDHKGYELDCGSYAIHVMESSSHLNIPFGEEGTIADTLEDNTPDKSNAYECCAFSITASNQETAAHLDCDDWSGNTVSNAFSDTDDPYYSMSMSAATGTMISPLDLSDGGYTSATMLSRSDKMTTLPTAPDMTIGSGQNSKNVSIPNEGYLNSDALELLARYQSIDADGFADEDEDWYVSDLSLLAGWTQGVGVIGDNGMYAITLDDMAGVALGEKDTDGKDIWVEFMNQLTWDEMCYLLEYGSHHTAEMSDIGKGETWDENGPNYTADTDLCWCGEPTVSATWNKDLCEQYGIMVANVALWQGMTGWYGPGMNTHRSAFSGRSPEYYSQDGIQGGYIAAAVVGGATSRGINVNVKHFALYDIGDIRGDGCVNASEQNMRENYLKPFQMAMQEGDAHAAMCAFNRIGAVYACQNYALIQRLARDEWGWTGYAMTDATGSIPYMTMDGLVRAGAQLPDSDYTSASSGLSGTWVDSYDWTSDETYGYKDQQTQYEFTAPVGAVMLTKTVTTTADDGQTTTETIVEYASPTQWYLVRMGAMYILYSQCNSAGNYNGLVGIDSDTHGLMWDATGSGEQGQDIVLDLIEGSAVDRDEHVISNAYVVGGSLPEGLTLEDGVLSGTINDAEDLSFTVEVIVDGWIKMEVEVSISNKAIVTMRSDISSGAVGDSVSTYVLFDYSNVEYTTDAVFEIVDGALPTGLTLNSSTGRLSGTLSEEGTFTFTVGVTATNPNDVVLIISQSSIDLVAGTFGMSDEAVIEMVKWSSFWQEYLGAYTIPATNTYYMTYTVDVAEGTIDSVTSGDLDDAVADLEKQIADLEAALADSESSSGGNGMAITGLVLGIVAIVLAAAVLVIVLLRRNKSDGSSSDKE